MSTGENRQTGEIALLCVDGFSGLQGSFFLQSQNFILDQLIGLVKGFDATETLAKRKRAGRCQPS